MKILKLRKWVKYLILGVINFIIILNLPIILQDIENNINAFRINVLIIALIIIVNAVVVRFIEK